MYLFLQCVCVGLSLVQLHPQPAGVLHVLIFQGTQFVLQDSLPLLQGLQAAGEDLTVLFGAAHMQKCSRCCN